MIVEWEYFWSEMIIGTPQLAQEELKMKISVAEFKKRLKKAYEAGRAKGRAEALDTKAAADAFANIGNHGLDPKTAEAFNDIFGGLFGGDDDPRRPKT